jgi:hypothetical protein
VNAPLHGLLAEYERCAYLRQADIDKLLAAGVSVRSLFWDGDSSGLTLARDNVAFLENNRFEFARNLRDDVDITSAVVIPCRDEFGDLADFIAWRGEQVAIWLGRVAMVGQHEIFQPRVGEPLVVHETVLDWLREGRSGIVVIDPERAAPLLHMAEPLGVTSMDFGRRLRRALTVRRPRILVKAERAAA